MVLKLILVTGCDGVRTTSGDTILGDILSSQADKNSDCSSADCDAVWCNPCFKSTHSFHLGGTDAAAWYRHRQS